MIEENHNGRRLKVKWEIPVEREKFNGILMNQEPESSPNSRPHAPHFS
jgi:hypothetical protein